MIIDAILPTYDRANLLPLAIESALVAAASSCSNIRIIVVDNNSSDNTREVVEHYAAKSDGKVIYLFEREQGRHHALNLGIAYSTAEIIAFFDDDEILDRNWFNVIEENLSDCTVDYIGGPYNPIWISEPPSWLPKTYNGVLGIVQNGPERRRYGSEGFRAMPVGGNLAVRRTVLDRCGPYSGEYMYSEDRYMYEQLISISAVGYYVPKLGILHHIPEHRLQKSYFRNWVTTEGRNRGKMDRERRQSKVILFGAPPWMWRWLFDSLAIWCAGLAKGKIHSAESFTAELDIRQFINFFIARNLPFVKEKYWKRI